MLARWTAVIALASAACGGGRGGGDPEAPHRFDDPKKALAYAVGKELDCMGDEVEFTPEPGPDGAPRYHVRGCGQRAIFLVRDGVAVLEAPTDESVHVRQIAMRASFRFSCHPGKITVTSADEGRTFGGTIRPSRALAKGCGQEAIFEQRSGGPWGEQNKAP